MINLRRLFRVSLGLGTIGGISGYIYAARAGVPFSQCLKAAGICGAMAAALPFLIFIILFLVGVELLFILIAWIRTVF